MQTVVLLMMSSWLIGCGQASPKDGVAENPAATPTVSFIEITASPTETATAVPTNTRTPLRSPTVLPTRTPTNTPALTFTATAAPATAPTHTLAAGENLLINGDFSDGFNGWSMRNGLWLIHDITGSRCDAKNPDWPDYMAEMDIDACTGCNTWSVGDEDWLWQEVSAPAHSVVTLQITEAHHMHSGTAEMWLYGSDDGVNWIEIYHRPELEAEYGAGHHCQPPPTFTHTFEATYAYYRLEFHGRIKEQGDGWIFGPLVLFVE